VITLESIPLIAFRGLMNSIAFFDIDSAQNIGLKEIVDLWTKSTNPDYAKVCIKVLTVAEHLQECEGVDDKILIRVLKTNQTFCNYTLTSYDSEFAKVGDIIMEVGEKVSYGKNAQNYGFGFSNSASIDIYCDEPQRDSQCARLKPIRYYYGGGFNTIFGGIGSHSTDFKPPSDSAQAPKVNIQNSVLPGQKGLVPFYLINQSVAENGQRQPAKKHNKRKTNFRK
jgi:hypothetical protein